MSRYNARKVLNGRLYEHVPHKLVCVELTIEQNISEGGAMNTMLNMGVGVLTN